MPKNQDRSHGSLVTSTYAGMGLEFGGAVIGFCLLGIWIDHHWQIKGHWGVLICGFLGIVGGLYNLIRQGLSATRDAAGSASSPHVPEPDKPPNEQGAKPPDA